MLVSIAVYGVAIPLAVALVVVLAGARPWQGPGGPSGRVAGGIAVAIAYFAVFGAAPDRGIPAFPPAEVGQWTLWLALVAAALAVLEARVDRAWVRWPLRAALVFGGLALMLAPLMEHTWQGGEGRRYLLALGVGILFVWGALEHLAERRDGASMPMVLAASALGGAGVVAVAASIATAQLAIVLGVAVGVPTLVAWWRGSVSIRGALTVFAPILGLLWAYAWLYDDVDGWAMLLVAAAPLLAWLGEIPLLRDRAAWVAAALRVVLVILPIGGAMAVSELPAAESTRPAGEGEEEEYEVDEDGSYRPY